MEKPTLLLIFIVISIIFLITSFNEKFENIQIGIVTTVKNPHQINDWIKYHLKIGFVKLYIVLDDENENIQYDDNRVKILKNNKQWRDNLIGPNHLQELLDQYDIEVMSRQIVNFNTIREIAKKDKINWLLHIDADELFYTENNSLETIFDNKYDTIKFDNYEMIPTNDNYRNCFQEGIMFKTDKNTYLAYVNGKSAVKVNSNSEIIGVHGFLGGSYYESPIGKILHYPSCNFNEYLTKYKILGNFNDKWWNKVSIPIKFHLESRDIIQSCKLNENECIDKIREFYNKKNMYNSNINGIIKIKDISNIILN